ncbi:LpxI family protein [Kaistia terrae]|uniref:LpxI family protein n=1 Tax=Kaistia terrae TaxID=537017 RepID=A0ABW0PW22_9HYPH|nr:UDP-2,3-diacylglucosamine diphosphatase LpxI [Kaistia terrae]MCX5577290.1 UDP-2,3-diacylglucosamine diphosphatase LpxI [Kaistia terrae]
MTETAQTAPSAPDPGTLGIICGGGAFPTVVAEAALKAGRKVFLLPIHGYAEAAAVARYPHEWIHIGAFGRLSSVLRRNGCRQVVFVGTVLRPSITKLRVDWGSLKLIPRVLGMFRGGDDHLLTAVGRIFEENGFELVGAHEIAPELLVPVGAFGAHQPSASDLADAHFGFEVVRALGRYDIGQGVVVGSRHVLAVEAAEGTDLMLERCRELRANGRIRRHGKAGVLVKAPKPGQDRRLDLPSIGPRTIELAAEAGLAGVAVEAGGVIAAEIEAIVRIADEKGLFIIGLDS